MKSLLSLIIFITFLVQAVSAIKLPPPPSGLSWQEIPEIKAALLRPTNWFFKREEQKGTLAYFITKEDIDKTGEFQTGLTVNVFHLKKDPAVERGKYMMDQMAVQKNGQKWSRDFGPFKEFGCDYEEMGDGGIIAHNLVVANPKTNTLYFFIFESPKSEGESAWKLGKQIMDNLALDDEV